MLVLVGAAGVVGVVHDCCWCWLWFCDGVGVCSVRWKLWWLVVIVTRIGSGLQ